jgi:glycosyltransferase involved in cell wall biosynthesis
MRICFVCNEYPPGPHGGIGTFTQVMARALCAAGHNVRVVGVYPHDYSAPEYEEDCGVRVWRFRQKRARLSWIRDRYRLYQTIARWIREEKVDLIDVPDYQGMSACWPRFSVPVISRIQGSQTYFADEMGTSVKKTAWLLEKSALQRSEFWCAVSNHAADRTRQLFRLSSGPHAILPNVVEIPADASNTQKAANRVVFTGTLTRKKGVISLIKAWPKVRRMCEQAELHILGKDGTTENGQSMRAHLEAQLNDSHSEQVYFHGHTDRDTLFKELRKAQVAVFPSYAETFGIAPLEAMACGVPTIYTSRPPGSELIGHARDGLLVDPGEPDEIADAIVLLLKDDRLAKQLGDAATERVQKKFSLDVVLEQNLSFYRNCIAQFSSRKTRLTMANAV